ncbi:hypothetical protein N7452_004712 [Penicillium brevicompactum]|uniref:Uncharacterized protein n=1 Tax=Penicillium brevicompactum TaxID=5074 RepID=A0A9W9UF01_PENBR|nr:hypothetical protein N7452_004712 [Penicillium brevicompactum]
MPRVLPWQRSGTETSAKKEATPRKRVKTESELGRDLTLRNPPISPSKRDFFRSSQSPPSSPIKQCPPQEFLIPGFDRDDMWVMVEDEFYAVAQTYTQHLHYAEYRRRRKEVKERHSTLAAEIERPTDERTPLPREVERRKENEAFRERQKVGLAQVANEPANKAGDDGDDGDDDQLWAGTHLQDFMSSPPKSRSLFGLQSRKSTTRAAAGFGQVPVAAGGRARVNSTGSFTSASRRPDIEAIEIDEETASDSDDDLDLEAHQVMAPPPRRTQSAVQHKSTPRPHGQSHLRNTPTSDVKTTPLIARPISTPGFKSRMQSLFDDLDDLPEPSEIENNTTFNANQVSVKQQPDTAEHNN